jgi:tetratricopeptide (TPR) repeat protein
VRYRRGDHDQAERLYLLSIPQLESTLGSRHPGTVLARVGLASVYAAQSKLDEAERLCRDALPDLRQAFGVEHPAVASVLRNLGRIEFRRGSYAEAELNYRRALASLEVVAGKGQPELADTLSDYAVLLKKTRRVQEAKDVQALARQILSDHARGSRRDTVAIEELEAKAHEAR